MQHLGGQHIVTLQFCLHVGLWEQCDGSCWCIRQHAIASLPHGEPGICLQGTSSPLTVPTATVLFLLGTEYPLSANSEGQHEAEVQPQDAAGASAAASHAN